LAASALSAVKRANRPDGLPASASAVRDGYVASGDKVVDDGKRPFFRQSPPKQSRIWSEANVRRLRLGRITNKPEKGEQDKQQQVS
jgi:hypothetical protein